MWRPDIFAELLRPKIIDISFVFRTRYPLYVALEYLNPSGSVKDRPVLNILLTALEKGLLKPGDKVVEITSGNTGIALAYWSNIFDLKAKIFIPRDMSMERKEMMKLLGAEVVEVDSFEEGKRLAKSSEGFYLGQFDRIENPLAYKELAKEFGKRGIRYFVAGVGTGGTIIGMKMFLRDITTIAVFPKEKNHGIQGIGDGIVGSFWREELIDGKEYVSTGEARRWMKILWKKGFLVGRSSGANIAVAIKYAEKGPTGTLFPDSWNRYISLENNTR